MQSNKPLHTQIENYEYLLTKRTIYYSVEDYDEFGPYILNKLVLKIYLINNLVKYHYKFVKKKNLQKTVNPPKFPVIMKKIKFISKQQLDEEILLKFFVHINNQANAIPEFNIKLFTSELSMLDHV